MAHDPTAVGIIGSGPVGTGIATPLAGADYEVTLGTRNSAAKKLSRLRATAVTAHADPGRHEGVAQQRGQMTIYIVTMRIPARPADEQARKHTSRPPRRPSVREGETRGKVHA
jgi:predicted dinucleotide-binding enzyme